MSREEIITALKNLQRRDYYLSNSCSCCGTNIEWEPSAYGDYVRWNDIEELLAKAEATDE